MRLSILVVALALTQLVAASGTLATQVPVRLEALGTRCARLSSRQVPDQHLLAGIGCDMPWLPLGLVLAFITGPALQAGHRSPPRAGLQGSPLLRAFHGDSDWDGRLKTVSLAEVSNEVRSELQRRLDRGRMFTSRLPVINSADPIQNEVAAKRVSLERATVTMLAAADVAIEAAEYASRYPVSYEWEGDESAPMREAQFARRYVDERPQSVLRPFQYVLLLHLYRCAFEAASWNANAEGKREAAAGYRWAWDRVMQWPDAAIRAVANDIDAESLLYIGDQGHPRTWQSPALGIGATVTTSPLACQP